MEHIRIPADIAAVVTALQVKNGLFPEFEGRSAAYIASELIRQAPTFQRAKKQIASERNPRPGAAVRTG